MDLCNAFVPLHITKHPRYCTFAPTYNKYTNKIIEKNKHCPHWLQMFSPLKKLHFAYKQNFLFFFNIFINEQFIAYLLGKCLNSLNPPTAIMRPSTFTYLQTRFATIQPPILHLTRFIRGVSTSFLLL